MQSHNSALRGGLGDVWDRKAAVCFQNWWSVFCLWPFLTLSGCLYSYTWWLSSSCYTYITPNQDRSLTRTTSERKKKCKHSCHVTGNLLRKWAQILSLTAVVDHLRGLFFLTDSPTVTMITMGLIWRVWMAWLGIMKLVPNVTNSEFKPTEVGKLTVKCSITFLVVFNLSYFIDTSIEYF